MPAPTFCYVILAHRFSGIEELVRRVRELSERAHVLVRFEDPEEFEAARLRSAGAIPLRSTICARWGAWTLTEAMVEALAVARGVTDADYFVVISGQDYPVRDLAAWEGAVRGAGVDALLDPLGEHPDDWRVCWRMLPVSAPRHGRAYRLLRHVAWRLGTLTRPLLWILPRFVDSDRRWLIGVLRLRPRPPGGVRVTKCSQWMTLSGRAVDAVVARDAADPALRGYFAGVRISDESYVQSLVHDDPALQVLHSATTARILDPGNSSPRLLDATAVRELADLARTPFVRKLAPGDDAARAAADELVAADVAPSLAPPRLLRDLPTRPITPSAERTDDAGQGSLSRSA